MRTLDEIVGKAANLKVRLISRAQRIEDTLTHMVRSESGSVKTIHPERLETMNRELEAMQLTQLKERHVYAALRWVIGQTDEIEPQNLELDR